MPAAKLQPTPLSWPFAQWGLMRHGVDGFSPSSWEPQEEGMVSTAVNFPSVRNQGLIVSRKKQKRQKVMPASFVTAPDNL
jgi:hypothetical protein